MKAIPIRKTDEPTHRIKIIFSDGFFIESSTNRETADEVLSMRFEGVFTCEFNGIVRSVNLFEAKIIEVAPLGESENAPAETQLPET